MRPTLSTHRLRRGLPDYPNPVCSHAFAPQCQLQAKKPPSPLVIPLISTHFHRYAKFLFSPCTPSLTVSNDPPRLSREFLSDLLNHLRALYLIIPDSLYLRITATCWHVVSRGFLVGTVSMCIVTTQSFSLTTGFTNRNPSSHAALLRQAFAHYGKFPTAASVEESGPVSSPSVTDPLRSAMPSPCGAPHQLNVHPQSHLISTFNINHAVNAVIH